MSDLGQYDRRGTIGDRLRAAREARGMSLDDVATRTRVPVRHLNAIEAGDWDALPAITYAIGFAKSYAGAVGLDPAEVGAELRGQLGHSNPAANAPYEPADPARVPPRGLAITAGLLALLLAIGYVVWSSTRTAEPDMLEIATAAPPTAAIAPTPAPTPLAGPAAPVPTGPVVLTANSEVWLRVYDAATGTTFHQGALQAGQSVQVPPTAQQPQIRTARAEALSVRIGTSPLPQLAPPGSVSGLSLRAQDLLAANPIGGAPLPRTPPTLPGTLPAAQPGSILPSGPATPLPRSTPTPEVTQPPAPLTE